jgi:putative transposase
MIDQMRRITDEATKTTRRTRRESERRRHAPAEGGSPPHPGPPPPLPLVEGGAEVPPAPWFDDIEQW